MPAPVIGSVGASWPRPRVAESVMPHSVFLEQHDAHHQIDETMLTMVSTVPHTTYLMNALGC